VARTQTKSRISIETPRGEACVHLHPIESSVAALVLGHGASGGIESADLAATTAVAGEEGVTVALVEQPYRVAGRRTPAPADHLDEAWLAVVERLRSDELRDLPLVVGGRSLGARVACRTAAEVGAIAVLCLAFPRHPPGKPEKDRLPELDAVTVPTLVVQGNRDSFGMPPPGPNREVVQVSGTHSLKNDLDAVAEAVRRWLRELLGQR
jgi:predicted alpha/beta-hydrolase family hydrolase